MNTHRKKLIEVALPLEAINKAAREEKSVPRHGHPQALHYWWARRPLAACRAVLFASLVDDPSSHPEKFPTEEDQDRERRRLFRIIEELVKWENSNNETVLQAARAEILKSAGGNPPPVLDPFCGGGSIPLEAQRLGLKAYASDLNPVAVLITKALIEIPPKFAGRPPVNPESRKKLDHSKQWRGAQGLAEDVRHYGQWMRDEAEKRIGHLYPKVMLPKERGGGEATVIAWLWARTVKCPNPACGAQMPLVRSFWLCGNKAWAEPTVDRQSKALRFLVKTGSGARPEGTVGRRGAECIACRTVVPLDYVREEARSGRMAHKLMAIVLKNDRQRCYLSPTDEHEAIARSAKPKSVPDTDLPDQALGFRVQLYGMTKHRDLFTPRQLTALTTFSDLIGDVWHQVFAHASNGGANERGADDPDAKVQAPAYADAVSTYLGCALSRLASYNNAICFWNLKGGSVTQIFSRQAISMSWDFIEVNPLEEMSGNWMGGIEWVAEVLENLTSIANGYTKQLDATQAVDGASDPLVSTDPPYYDNIGYADLADFFYVWLRRSLGKIYPDLFSTVLTPKAQELVATPYRFGGDKVEAERFFEEGLRTAFAHMREVQHPAFPMTVFYAFKQAESEDGDENRNPGDTVPVSTGWETMLQGLLRAGFAIAGTWPIRTERAGRPRELGSNALASSIVLVCRSRAADAPLATRREFMTALKSELPVALENLQRGNIAPVDLAQASIGPGMAVYSRYAKVLEADGSPMTVRTALGIINQVLDEVLAEEESEFDADTRWALAWFEQFGMEEASFGVAETLSKAKNTAVEGLKEAGILASKAGKVRLLRRGELAKDWDPAKGRRLTVWEVTQHLIRALEDDGEAGAAELLRKLGSVGEVARDLAYRLYNICDRNKWAQEALAYNSLVTAWPEITKLAHSERPGERQARLSL
jgi:putative DNA methylase